MTSERLATETMICPQTRTVQHPEGLKCLGSVCMHWRWSPVLDAQHKSAERNGFCGPAEVVIALKGSNR